MERRISFFAYLIFLTFLASILSSCIQKGKYGTENAVGMKYACLEKSKVDAKAGDIRYVQPDGSRMYGFADIYDEQENTTKEEILAFDWSGKVVFKNELDIGEGKWTLRPYIDENGNTYIFGYIVDVQGNKVSYSCPRLYKYDLSGKKVYEKELPYEVAAFYEGGVVLDRPVADSSGRLYIPQQSWYSGKDGRILLFDKNGEYDGEILCTNEIIRGLVCAKDGSVYVLCEDIQRKLSLYRIDYEKKEKGEGYGDLPDTVTDGFLYCAGDREFVIGNEKGLILYNAGKQISECLFEWFDVGINMADIRATAVLYDEGGEDDTNGTAGGSAGGGNGAGEGGVNRNTGSGIGGKINKIAIVEKTSGSLNISVLGKTDDVTDDERIIITIGTMDYYDSNFGLGEFVNKFNLQSDKYKVKVVSYFAQGASHKDVAQKAQLAVTVSSDCPDIFMLTNITPDYTALCSTLAKKGYFLDLGPYLDADGGLSREDYLEGVLSAYTVNGRLISIPLHFNLCTCCGKTSLLGEGGEMSLRDFVRLMKAHSDDDEFGADLEAYAVLEIMLKYNNRAFVEKKNGVNTVDKELLADFLEVMRQLNEKKEGSLQSKIYYPDTWRTDRLFLSELTVLAATEIQSPPEKYGEPVTYVGYPTGNDTSAVMLGGYESPAIVSRTKNVEGAWEFIEFYLSYGAGERNFSQDFWSRKDKYEDEWQREFSDKDSHYSQNYGDYKFESHSPTEDEKELIDELISCAQSAILYGDNSVYHIVIDEIKPYLNGDRTLYEAVDIIADRIQIYVDEQE